MNNEEVSIEVMRDYRRIHQSTFPRIYEQYHAERKKMRVDMRSDFVRDYIVTSSSKNTWVITCMKVPTVKKYKDKCHAVANAITYYYPEKGLRVFRPSEKFVEVFNGHFFKRYNERMGLNLHQPLDVVKKFFHSNAFIQPDKLQNGEGKNEGIMSVCKDGLALGTWVEHSTRWLVHNTFITHDQKHNQQRSQEQQLFEKAHKHFDAEIAKSNDLETVFVARETKKLYDYLARRA